MKVLLSTVGALAILCGAPVAQAGVIIQPKAVTVNIGGELLNYSAANMINQSGLSKTYVSGVTDFDTYIASNPIHSASAGEWLSTGPVSFARVTFDLGEVTEFNGFAIWNEDSSSIGSIIASVFPGGSYIGVGLNDTLASIGRDYGPTVQGHQVVKSRYVQFDIYGCNRAGFTHNGCGLGEVAFRSTALPPPPPPPGVPEPATWAMMLLGFFGLGSTIRARRSVLSRA